MGRPPLAADNGSPNGDCRDRCPRSIALSLSLANSLSRSEWIEVTEKRLQLSQQQGFIVRLMMTLPGEIVLVGGGIDANGEEIRVAGNSNERIALALNAERTALLASMGGGQKLLSAEEDGRRKGARGRCPVPVETVAKQLKVVFKRLGVHSRMELAQRVDYEIAVMRGWVKPTEQPV